MKASLSLDHLPILYLEFFHFHNNNMLKTVVTSSLSWREKCTPQDYGYKTPKYTPSNP